MALYHGGHVIDSTVVMQPVGLTSSVAQPGCRTALDVWVRMHGGSFSEKGQVLCGGVNWTCGTPLWGKLWSSTACHVIPCGGGPAWLTRHDRLRPNC
eukprot:73468-Amphidinium_carterae.1